MNTIKYNPNIKLAISDVDETIADVYTPAEPEMIAQLSEFLQSGAKLFMVTGGSLVRIQRDILDCIDPVLRRDVIISHCSGAEVWGFTETGILRGKPFYSVYEERFTPYLKHAWRESMSQLIDEFDLRTHPAQPKIKFWDTIGHEPLDIMLDDRGPQITMEVVNGIDLTAAKTKKIKQTIPLTHGKRDLRTPIAERANELFIANDIPVTPRFGGNFALDFAVSGVSKTTSIKSVLANPEVLATIGLTQEDVQNPDDLEVWGDKFGKNGGTDRHMSEALPPEVRSIDFRQENPAEFPAGYNIVVWDGKKHLHHGLLEYLQSRNT